MSGPGGGYGAGAGRGRHGDPGGKKNRWTENTDPGGESGDSRLFD